MQQTKNPMSDVDKMQSFDTLNGKQVDLESLAVEPEAPEQLDEDRELTEKLNQMLSGQEQELQKQVEKRLRKYSRELHRLRLLGEAALIDGNEEQYVYCIGKIRKIAGKSVPDDVLHMMYKTSRERVLEMMSEAQ